MVIEAYVFITVKKGFFSNKMQDKTLEELKAIPGVEQANKTTGRYNIITKVRAESLAHLSETVAEGIHNINGVSSTTTCMIIC